MNYLPFENITYTTKHDPEEIRKRLNEVVEPKQLLIITGFFSNGDHKPYEGSINEDSFNINRIAGYREAFTPIINGRIEKEINGSKITVKIRLSILALVFFSISFTVAGNACYFFLALFNIERFELIALITFGMLILFYALTISGFKSESIKSKNYLARLFNAEIER